MGIKEQVKKGLLTKADAIGMVSKDSHTYGWLNGWLKRRGTNPVAPPVAAKVRKYRSKKIAQP